MANIYLFARRNRRFYACSWYFIGLSVTHLLLLDTLGVSRLMIAWINADYAASNVACCKIRSYLFSLSLILSRQFICLISIDRWLVTSSSAWLHNQSSLKNHELSLFVVFYFGRFMRRMPWLDMTQINMAVIHHPVPFTPICLAWYYHYDSSTFGRMSISLIILQVWRKTLFV